MQAPRSDEHDRTAHSAPSGRAMDGRVFEQILQIAADAIVTIDEARRIIHFNRGAAQIFGYEPEEVLGAPLGMLLPPRFREMHPAYVEAFGQSADTARLMGHRREVYGLRKDGTEFPAEASILKLETDDGRRLYSAVVRDVTEQKRLYEDARRATRARDEVLGVVSHDLRNPLGAIAMCSRVLLDNPPEDPAARRELVVAINDATTWMSRLIQDLLEVSAIDRGVLSVQCRPEPVAPILQRTVALFDRRAAERGVALRVEIQDHLPLVNVDGERMAQAVANLLDNALKFTPAGGAVRVAAAARDGAVELTVEDTGRGIPAEDLEHIFDRYWRTRSRGGGSGLGLAIARGIAEAHAGRIDVSSRPGEGTRFTITVPAP